MSAHFLSSSILKTCADSCRIFFSAIFSEHENARPPFHDKPKRGSNPSFTPAVCVRKKRIGGGGDSGT